MPTAGTTCNAATNDRARSYASMLHGIPPCWSFVYLYNLSELAPFRQLPNAVPLVALPNGSVHLRMSLFRRGGAALCFRYDVITMFDCASCLMPRRS
jgi:hypothetical protein